MPAKRHFLLIFALPFISLAVMLLVAASPVFQPQEADEPQMTFKLDPVHCMANFRVQHMGAGMFWGRFNEVSGKIVTTDEGMVPVSFDVVIDVDSIDTGTEKLDRTLMGPNFFDGKEFKTITFTTSGISPVAGADAKWTVTGQVSMLGVTKPVSAVVERTGVNGSSVMKKAGYEAIFSIKRSDFGMSWGVDNGALGDEVDLVVGLEGDWSA
jgi:polyisoprenoid-binding protein YceI